jgi:2-dehydropantoate 2-reductase
MAAALAERAGVRVTVIDHRADRAARLSAAPVVIHTPQGDRRVRLDVRVAPDAPPDLVLLATKATALRAAAAEAGAWRAGAPLVTLQNGLDVAREAALGLPGATVVAAVIYLGANLVAEGEVTQVALLRAHVGYEGRPADALAEAVAALLTRAGLPARAEADIVPLVWGKALVNAAMNPVGALAGVVNGDVAARPTLRAMACALADEGEAVARAEGVALPYASAAQATLETARATAANRCSMLQDLEAGRATEIEFLSGAIVRRAEARGIAVPANRAAAALVRQVSAHQEANRA